MIVFLLHDRISVYKLSSIRILRLEIREAPEAEKLGERTEGKKRRESERRPLISLR